MRHVLPLVTAAAALTFAGAQAEAQLTPLSAGATGAVSGAVSGTLPSTAGTADSGTVGASASAIGAENIGATLPSSADAAIGGRLQGRLRAEQGLSGVHSDVRHGVARLRGSVATEVDKRRAARIAHRIDGVTRVRNEIAVRQHGGQASRARNRNGKEAASASLGAAVKSNIDASGPLAQRDIRVEQTNERTVRLTGTVRSEAEKDLAGRIATHTDAVAAVRNDIVVHRSGSDKP